MLSRVERVHKDEIPAIFKRGLGVSSVNVSFRYVKNDSDRSAFNIVISSKVAKKAVDRNFIKRRGRHVIKKHLNEIEPGYQGVFVIKKNVADQEFSLFEQELLNLLHKAKLIK